MKLREYAKKQNITYKQAWRLYKTGKIQGFQLDKTGTIYVDEVNKNISLETKHLTGNDLSLTASFPHVFDNQFLTDGMIESVKDGKPTDFNSMSSFIRGEYLKSLIFNEQTILNRAFMINNKEVFQDIVGNTPNKAAFSKLLEEKALLPFLFFEKDIQDKPNFQVNEDGWKAFSEILENTNIYPLKMSWDDTNNVQMANSISRTYTAYIMAMQLVGQEIAVELNIKDTASFIKRLTDVSRFCLDEIEKTGKPVITRQKLYEKFVCIDNTNVAERHYDLSKPYWLELKTLFDMKYNVNIPDIVGANFLSSGRGNRSILRETDLSAASYPTFDVDLSKMFSGIYMDTFTSFGTPEDFSMLDLQDVLKIRHTQAWEYYMQELNSLKEQINDSVFAKLNMSINYSAFYERMKNLQEYIKHSFENNLSKKSQNSILIKIGGGEILIFPSEKKVLLKNEKNINQNSDNLIVRLNNGSIAHDMVSVKISDPKDNLLELLGSLKSRGYAIHRSQFEVKDSVDNEPKLLDETFMQ